MKKIRNQATLKYDGKTRLSNVVESEMIEITDFCECINDCIKVRYITDDKRNYTYSLKSDCGEKRKTNG